MALGRSGYQNINKLALRWLKNRLFLLSVNDNCLRRATSSLVVRARAGPIWSGGYRTATPADRDNEMNVFRVGDQDRSLSWRTTARSARAGCSRVPKRSRCNPRRRSRGLAFSELADKNVDDGDDAWISFCPIVTIAVSKLHAFASLGEQTIWSNAERNKRLPRLPNAQTSTSY